MAGRGGSSVHGANIKEARERNYLSRRELGALVDQSYEWVWKIENEWRTVPREKLCRLADVLGVPIEHIERKAQKPTARKRATRIGKSA